MDVWAVPYSSCPGLDKDVLMDVGPKRAGELSFGAEVEVTAARNTATCSPSTDYLKLVPAVTY